MTVQQVSSTEDFTKCYDVAPMRQSAADRFIFRVLALLDEKHMNQKDLRGGKSEGWISSKLKGYRKLKLNEAEDIATALQYPLTELLRRPEDRVYELDNLEARLVEAFRHLSAAEQEAVLTTVTLRQRPGPYKQERTHASRTDVAKVTVKTGLGRDALEIAEAAQDLLPADRAEVKRQVAELARLSRAAHGPDGGGSSLHNLPEPAERVSRTRGGRRGGA